MIRVVAGIFFAILYFELRSNTVVSGSAVAIRTFPYQVSLRKNGEHICDGSIINDYWILTVAHCIINSNVESLTIVVGTDSLKHRGSTYQVERTVIHPDFDNKELKNNIGLIKVNGNIEFNEYTKPIALPNSDIDKFNYPAIISGWNGFSHLGSFTNKLEHINVRLLDHLTCSKIYMNMTREKICTFPEKEIDYCFNVSGSPLVADDVQVGIVSNQPLLCGSRYPDVYTRVWNYIDWIKERTNENEECYDD